MRRLHHPRSAGRLTALILVCLLAALLPAAPPARAATPLVLELESIADARVQGGSPDAGFGGSYLWIGTPEGHRAYVQFDLAALPADATIGGAELRLAFQGTYDGAASAELGRNDGAWDEATVTWDTRPPSTFGGATQPVGDDPALVTWDVTALARQWHAGSLPNYGFALRGDGVLKAFHSRETATPPVLAITYTLPPSEGPRPDFGDAPDSSNSLGVSPNTAYPGVPGGFPTVWAGTPAGDPAGPRHANQGIEGILGNALSREAEADSGGDADGPNNILAGGADNADNDRADDGWRNRSVPFFDCAATTLRVRVSKAAGAQLERMFLNVWFDGNRDGDWGDRRLCTPDGEALAIPSHEWIVQDYFVDMAGIPAGGYVDIDVPTATVLNTTPGERHWMRFTLSEERAPSAAGRADGRGPHPSVGSYRFGETEDVLQRPPRPGEGGALELSKRVVTDGDPVEWIDYVTYEIRLRQRGGTQPVQARIRDVLPYPLIVYPTIDASGIRYVDVASPGGGAAPLTARLDVIPPSGSDPPRQVVSWQGSLAPDSELLLRFQVRVLALCEPNQQTMTFLNRAEAQARGGDPLAAEERFDARCLGYDEEEISFTPVKFEGPIDTGDLSQVPWRAEVWNRHPFPVRLGLYVPGAAQIAQDNTAVLELGPGERKLAALDVPIAPGDDNPLDATGDPRPIAVGFCLLLPESDACPDPGRYPNYHGEAPPADATPRGGDLGDAPDSSNHAGAAMAAYPGTPAAFPTVFDPATGLPQGPRHLTPRPLHLGERVSREAEADLGPDQDPLNNIVPAANDPDNDRGDDGSRLIGLAHCQPATAEVRLFISPQAAAWFQQQGAPAYLNAWVDGNRDGDWADGAACPGPDGAQPALEHILIDQPVDVAALGAGLHSLTFTTGRAPWPADQAERPAWVRFTLSERESNKTLQLGALKYGDGRGYDKPFRTGETEDHLLRAQGDSDAAPDLGVSLGGRIAGGAGQGGADRVSLTVEYANDGGAPAAGASLRLAKPAQLRDRELALLRAPGIPAQAIVETEESVTISLPALAPGAEGRVLLGWEAPPGQAPAGDYEAQVEARLAGDGAPENNRAALALARPAAPLRLAVEAGDGTVWGLAETTCSDFVRLPGESELNTLYDLWIDGAVDLSFTASVSPWVHAHPDTAEGFHEIWFAPNPQADPPLRSNSVRLNVDTGLPVDPRSLTFTDSQGRSYHPPTLSWRRLGAAVAAHLRSGETYEIAIDSCVDSPNQQIELTLPSGDAITMADPEGDGRYTGSFVFDESGSVNTPLAARGGGEAAAPSAASGELLLTVRGGGAEQRFGLRVEPLAPGDVRDAADGRPLGGVSVTPLAADQGGALPAAATGGQGAQTTGADGAYSFATMGGSFRLLATRAGYQPYRSWEVATAGGVLAAPIRLAPEIAGPADHTIFITAGGFVPAQLEVAAGDVVEWVNLDQAERGVVGAGWDSGALAPGASYRARLSAAGSYAFADASDPLSTSLVVVDGGELRLFLPLLRR